MEIVLLIIQVPRTHVETPLFWNSGCSSSEAKLLLGENIDCNSDELVKNGTFDGGEQEWTAGTDSTMAVTNGQVTVGGTYPGGGFIYQSLNLTEGETYTLIVDIASMTGTGGKVYIGPTDNGVWVDATGTHSHTFTYTSGSTLYLQGPHTQ